jgi:hypothetical protein
MCGLLSTPQTAAARLVLMNSKYTAPEEPKRNFALSPRAVPSASSCIAGHPIHKVAHLNDGNYGNSYSWISAGEPDAWAQIELPEPVLVNRVVFSRDRLRQFGDRMPTQFTVCLSQDGATWTTVAKVSATAAAVNLSPQSPSGPGNIPSPPPPPKGVAMPDLMNLGSDATEEDKLRYAFLAEEHAWVKTWGYADLDPRLVPYNGRVKEYPRHVGDDVIPLPELEVAPALDVAMNDAGWKTASRGVARVAWPYDFNIGPLVEHTVLAGHYDGYLYLGITVDRLLSEHLVIVSTPDMKDAGVVAVTDKGMVFRVYGPGDAVEETPVEGFHDESFTRFVLRLPLDKFPDCREKGLRLGLGMGGRHTPIIGRPITLKFADFSLTEVAPCVGRVLLVHLFIPDDADETTVSYMSSSYDASDNSSDGDRPVKHSSDKTITLIPGMQWPIHFVVPNGAIGQELRFDVTDATGETYTLHLLRYDPLDRTLPLFRDMFERFEKQGMDISAERTAYYDNYIEIHRELLKKEQPDRALERAFFFEVRNMKRKLFMRAPDLKPIEQILFVKRNAFEPSHNYSDYFDSAWRPGGGVFTLSIPEDSGYYVPERAQLTQLFDSGSGIARNPMADFDLDKVYFSYKPTQDGYYHVMSVEPDGSDLRQLTDGPFHDLWPCPLPDGDLTVISTRCTARFICWRPQASVLFRMKPDGTEFQPLSFANLTEWASSVMSDGRIIWTRSEYQDKGADFGHTLWAIRPDGSYPELIFGNTIIQPNGYANGREVPGTKEFSCTLISHFGDLNGPIALVDTAKGRMNKEAITSLTPEVPWPGMWPDSECFREAFPLSRDYFLCAHAPRRTFGIYVIDRYGNREMLFLDPEISSMCPTPFRVQSRPPVLAAAANDPNLPETGEFILQDVYQGISPPVKRGDVKYIRISEEVRATLDEMPDGSFRADHPEFQDWYATPVHKVSGPHGWTTYVAKASHGIVPVEEDGSARFTAPSGKVLYFAALDENFNELQRMRSIVQMQPGEVRSCIGCHEHREMAPNMDTRMLAREVQTPITAEWEGQPFSYERVVQPVLDTHCIRCHNENHPKGLNYSGERDADKVPISYRTLIEKGLVHYADMGWNSGGCEKIEPLSLGVLKSRLWQNLDSGHQNISLTTDEMLRIKTWIDLNCPLWPDYKNRLERE